MTDSAITSRKILVDAYQQSGTISRETYDWAIDMISTGEVNRFNEGVIHARWIIEMCWAGALRVEDAE